ncbi:MAG: response regulator [Alphaproteobacteria bacterium]
MKRSRVLLVEDNYANRCLGVAFLALMDIEADIAANGHEAVEAVRGRAYDAVLMDIQMPGMNGLDAAAAIRRLNEGGARVPIIAMTAHAMKEDREKYLAAGMDDYLPKPVNRKALAAMLAKWLPAGRE